MISRRAIVGVAVISYVAACVAPVLRFDQIENATRPPQIMRGYEVLLLGWQGIFAGNFAWMANVLLLASALLLLTSHVRAAAISAGIALVVALQTLTLLGARVIADEGGVTHMTMSRLYVGFYLWIASIAVMLAGSLWREG
jgi:hypothetical protein